MWISKKNDNEIELKSIDILLPFIVGIFILFGVPVVLAAAERGDYYSGFLGLLLVAIGLVAVFFFPYGNIALFDKGRSKLTIRRNAILSKREDVYAMDEVDKLRIVKVRRNNERRDELWILLRNGKKILLTRARSGGETEKNAIEISSFLDLQLEETENYENIWQEKKRQ